MLTFLPSVSLTSPLAACSPSKVSPSNMLPLSKVPRIEKLYLISILLSAHHDCFILFSENIKANVTMITQTEHHLSMHNQNYEF